jgi:hypothetical protein
MSNSPRSLLKSRENLQAIFRNFDTISNSSGIKKYEVFDRILSVLWNNIRQLVHPLNGTPVTVSKYIINLRDPNYYSTTFIFTEEIALELIEILKKEYPGVDFTYNQTAGYDGQIIEKLIIMDWS